MASLPIAFIWSTLDKGLSQGISFLVGVYLMSVLSPVDFGLIGIMMVIVAISTVFVDGGFQTALIQKKDPDMYDYSSVFFANITVAIIIYAVLYFGSELFARLYKEPLLIELIRIYALLLITNSFSIIHTTILTKELNFKVQAISSFVATLVSSLIAIVYALNDGGVKALILLALSKSIILNLMLWFQCTWRPKFLIDLSRLKELWGFSSKMMMTAVINSLYENIQLLLIGRTFSTSVLGLYTRSTQVTNIFARTFTEVITRVAYPNFSRLQNDNSALYNSYLKLLKFSLIVVLPISIIVAINSKVLVLEFLGSEWYDIPKWILFLSAASILYPFHSLTIHLALSKGNSKGVFVAEIKKKILGIAILYISISGGVLGLIFGQILLTYLALLINLQVAKNTLGFFYSQVFTSVYKIFLSALLACALGLLVDMLEVVWWSKILLNSILIILGFLVFLWMLDRKEFINGKSIIKKYVSSYTTIFA